MLCLLERGRSFRVSEEYYAGLRVLRLVVPERGRGRRLSKNFLLKSPPLTLLCRETLPTLRSVHRVADASTLIAARAAELLMSATEERERVTVFFERLGKWERRCLIKLGASFRYIELVGPRAYLREAAELLNTVGVSPITGSSADAAVLFCKAEECRATLAVDVNRPPEPGLFLLPPELEEFPEGFDRLKIASYAIETGIIPPERCEIGVKSSENKKFFLHSQ